MIWDLITPVVLQWILLLGLVITALPTSSEQNSPTGKLQRTFTLVTVYSVCNHGQLNTWTCIKNESQAISGPPLQKRFFRKIALKTKVFVVKTKVKHHSNA